MRRDDLEALLEEQRALLAEYCVAFDSGKTSFAKPIATALRVLLHDTKASHALLEQLDILTRVSYLNTAFPIHPQNLAPTWGLVSARMTAVDDAGNIEGGWSAQLDATMGRGVRQQYRKWWEEPVARDGLGQFWSRKDLVLAVSNKDGGAHVDPKLPAAYEALSRKNAFGVVFASNGIETPAPDPVPASIRQVAHELLLSLEGWPKPPTN